MDMAGRHRAIRCLRTQCERAKRTLAAKLEYALDAGRYVVFCIGEPKVSRERGRDAVVQEMDTQLTLIYGLLDPVRVWIAYEPAWAIGTGLTATPEDVEAGSEEQLERVVLGTREMLSQHGLHGDDCHFIMGSALMALEAGRTTPPT